VPEIQRTLLQDLQRWIDRREILAVRGPRQAGKTTLLRMLADWLVREKGVDEKHVVYLTFEDRGVLDEFVLNPKEFVSRHHAPSGRTFMLIDEAQYAPDLGQKLKLVYDLFENLKLVVTGSSSLELRSQTGKYLVGRLFELELLPLSFLELLRFRDPGLARVYEEWHSKLPGLVRAGAGFEPKKDADALAGELSSHMEGYLTYGGYPAVWTTEADDERKQVLRGIINTYIDRDIVSFLQITDTIKFRRLVRALAASNGAILRIEPLATEIGSHFRELTKLIDVLEQTYVVRRVAPYHRNRLSELRKAPKIYFVDPGLRNAVLDDFNPPDARADAGTLVESFVLGELGRYASLAYWRTASGAEVDFVSEAGRGLPLPIEVKYRRLKEPAVGKSLHSFIRAYSPGNCLVLTREFWGKAEVGETKLVFVPVYYA
jgi:predicted AAA+ superfamily ATPase